jgi:hypothetical protein
MGCRNDLDRLCVRTRSVVPCVLAWALLASTTGVHAEHAAALDLP